MYDIDIKQTPRGSSVAFEHTAEFALKLLNINLEYIHSLFYVSLSVTRSLACLRVPVVSWCLLIGDLVRRFYEFLIFLFFMFFHSL